MQERRLGRRALIVRIDRELWRSDPYFLKALKGGNAIFRFAAAIHDLFMRAPERGLGATITQA
jgi:hypothetical protein